MLRQTHMALLLLYAKEDEARVGEMMGGVITDIAISRKVRSKGRLVIPKDYLRYAQLGTSSQIPKHVTLTVQSYPVVLCIITTKATRRYLEAQRKAARDPRTLEKAWATTSEIHVASFIDRLERFPPFCPSVDIHDRVVETLTIASQASLPPDARRKAKQMIRSGRYYIRDSKHWMSASTDGEGLAQAPNATISEVTEAMVRIVLAAVMGSLSLNRTWRWRLTNKWIDQSSSHCRRHFTAFVI